PGVISASAAWDLYAGVPALILRVLLAAGREAEFAAMRDAIAHAQRCRGPDRCPLVVQQALLRYAFLDLAYARDPTFVRDDVQPARVAATRPRAPDAYPGRRTLRRRVRMTKPRVPLFDRLPEIYRTRDAEQVPPGQLRAFLGAVELPFDALYQNISQLYEDLF